MLVPVLCVLRGNAADERVGRVTVCEQGADGEQHFGDGQGRTPVLLQNVQTDGTSTVDVAVVDPGAECHLLRKMKKEMISFDMI